MLVVCDRLKEICFGQLMAVYEEGNLENGQDLYPDLSESEQLLRAEQDFYQYLRDVFYKTDGAFYCMLEVQGSYVSALRLEPYRDGLLLEALETSPNQRKRGYASQLVRQVLQLEQLKGKKIYSHVGKRNVASLQTHLNCGFQIISDRAVYIDGSVNDRSYTLCYESNTAGA